MATSLTSSQDNAPIPPAYFEKITQFSKHIISSLHEPDAALATALEASNEIAPISVTEIEGKFLYLLSKIRGAKRVLEIGTLGGYSAIWFAKAVAPLQGKVVSLEIDADSAEKARRNIARAGFGEVVDVVVGKAVDSLETIFAGAAKEEGGERVKVEESFDVVFIDADKVSNVTYFEYALKLGRVGTVLVFDNVVRQGRALPLELGGEESDSSQGVREVFVRIAEEQRAGRVEATALQTVGEKGWDGFAVVLVTA